MEGFASLPTWPDYLLHHSHAENLKPTLIFSTAVENKPSVGLREQSSGSTTTPWIGFKVGILPRNELYMASTGKRIETLNHLSCILVLNLHPPHVLLHIEFFMKTKSYMIISITKLVHT